MTFIEGANQWLELGADRAKRHADRLGLPMTIVHNASFVKETPGQNKGKAQVERLLEAVSSPLLVLNLSTEQSVANVSKVMANALETGKPAYFGGYSQGSILVGKALQKTKDEYVKAHGGNNSAARKKAEQSFEEKAGKTLNVMTFGNAYKSYPKGPNYLHTYIKGDPVVDNGTRPDSHPADAKTNYLVFDQVFPGKKPMENHNMLVTTELLKQTAELNGFAAGDLPALFKAASNPKSLKVPTAVDVDWPKDMNKVMWDSKSDLNAASRSSATHRKTN